MDQKFKVILGYMKKFETRLGYLGPIFKKKKSEG